MKLWNKYLIAALAIVVAIFALAIPSLATALTTDRTSPQRTGDLVAPIQGSNVIFAGSIVAVGTDGLALPAANTSSLKVLGRAEVKSDNTGVNYSATKNIQVRRGIFQWDNGASNNLTRANIADLAYAIDDQTVGRTNEATNAVVVGRIVDVDASGIWVDTRQR